MRDSKQYDLMEILDEVKDYQCAANMLGLEVNVILMYQAFYEQHKQRHGSFRFLKNPEYLIRMQQRYDYIFCQINAVIESKLEYKKAMDYASQMGCL